MIENLPKHWQEWLKSYALKLSDGKHETLRVGAFKDNLKLTFPDGSKCSFNFAFHVKDEERNELLVLTEHCGYHIFPLYGVIIEG